MWSINDNLNKLVEKISEITDIKEVVTYYKNMTSTPQAVIVYRSTTEDVISTLNIKLLHTFRIVIRTEFENNSDQELYTRQLSQSVLDKLNSNRNLDQTVEFVNIDSIIVDSEEVDDKTRDITIEVTVQNFNEIS